MQVHHIEAPIFTHAEALEVSTNQEGYISLMEVVPTEFSVMIDEDVRAQLSFAVENEVHDGPGLDSAILACSGLDFI